MVRGRGLHGGNGKLLLEGLDLGGVLHHLGLARRDLIEQLHVFLLKMQEKEKKVGCVGVG